MMKVRTKEMNAIAWYIPRPNDINHRFLLEECINGYTLYYKIRHLDANSIQAIDLSKKEGDELADLYQKAFKDKSEIDILLIESVSFSKLSRVRSLTKEEYERRKLSKELHKYLTLEEFQKINSQLDPMI